MIAPYGLKKLPIIDDGEARILGDMPKQTILTSLLARVHLSDLFHKTVVSAAHVTVGPGVASIAIKMLSVCRGFE